MNGAGCTKDGQRYPLDSAFFNHRRNAFKVIKLQISGGKPFNKFLVLNISIGPKDVIVARQELTQKYNEEVHELERELDKNVRINII